MSTPLDKHGYVMSESDGQSKRYRLILGFASLTDLQAAHEYVVKHCNCQSPTSEGYSAKETPAAPLVLHHTFEPHKGLQMCTPDCPACEFQRTGSTANRGESP